MTDTTDPTKPVAWMRWNEAAATSTGVTDTEYYRDLWTSEGDTVVPLVRLSEYERVKAERDEAVAKLNDIAAEEAAPTSLFEQYEARSEALEAENRRLREALGFYADRKNWDDGGFSNEDGPNVITLVPSSIDNDQGKKARSALEASHAHP